MVSLREGLMLGGGGVVSLVGGGGKTSLMFKL
ncbi:MAG: putative selenium-dependent hydroxylase accessory protein YqeC, partial [Deltaproteobacteria bacterium]|nr:putative selenium-dependent hydroxylase accessory protein YqeC [Deltaproteobacteria bacterium]